jgi:hypothetical protein
MDRDRIEIKLGISLASSVRWHSNAQRLSRRADLEDMSVHPRD